MNALTATPPTASISALVPRNMQDAMALASMMAQAGFLARELQNPGGAMFVVEQSMRWNMSPFAVAMETSFIQGKPMFSGKIVGAAVQSSGVLAGRLTYDYTGTGDDRTVKVIGTLRGESEPRTVSVRAKDARTSNKMWQTQLDQQLAYHGNRVWARRHAPEVMLGVYSPEEFEPEQPRDVPNLQHAPGSQGAVMAALQAPAEMTLPLVGPDGVFYEIERKGDHPAVLRWLSFARKAVAKVALDGAEALRMWRAENGRHFAEISQTEPEAVKAIEDAIDARLKALAPPEPEEETEAGGYEPEEQQA